MVKKILQLLSVIFSVVLGMRIEKSRQDSKELNSVKIARKKENENSHLTTDQLIDDKL